MKAGSLFSGIGGIDLGLEAAGFDVRWQVELDGAARSVLKRHWPDVARYTDAREVGREQLEPVDLVAGGFPCTDLSVAGRRAGLGGEQSRLWWEFHRVLSELRPRWCLVENVPGLLSSNGGEDARVLLDSLEALGYVVDIDVLDAQFFGLAQRRRRILICGQLASRLMESGTEAAAQTVAQCLLECLRLAVWPRGDSLQRRMKLFALDSPGAASRLLASLAVIQPSSERAPSGSASGAGGASRETFAATKSRASTEATGRSPAAFRSTEPSWSDTLDEALRLLNESITSTAESRTTELRIFSCAQTALRIAGLITPSTRSLPSFWSAASSASTTLEGFISYARQASSSVLTDVEWIHGWRHFEREAERALLALGSSGDGRGGAALLSVAEGLLGDLAAGRAPRSDVAGTLGGGAPGSGWRNDLDRSGAFIVNAAESCARASHARPSEVARALDTTGGFSANQGGTVVAAYDASGLAEQARTLLSPRPGGGGSLVADTVRASSGKSTSSNAQLVEVVAFDERNVTSPDNRSNPQPGAPCHTLNGDAPLIAGTLRHSGKGAGSATQQDAQAGLIVAATLTSGGNPNSNAPGRRHEDDENPVAQTFDWQVAGSNRTWIHDKPDGPVRALTAQKTMAVAFQCHGSNVGPLGALRQGNGNETGGVPFLDARVGVRRLTPLECARLQGFPDWWLDGLGLSDAAKYRQLGNAMPPPMAYWVAARVVALERRLAVAEPESASA